MLSFILDVNAAGDPQEIAREAETVETWGKASPPARGLTSVLLSGEPEAQARQRRLAEEPIDEKSLADILVAARSLGLGQDALDRAPGR